MNKTAMKTKKGAATTASINAKFAIGIKKGATGALVKSFAPGRVPSLKAYPNLVNMVTTGAKANTVLLKIGGQYCWAPANKVSLVTA